MTPNGSPRPIVTVLVLITTCLLCGCDLNKKLKQLTRQDFNVNPLVLPRTGPYLGDIYIQDLRNKKHKKSVKPWDEGFFSEEIMNKVVKYPLPTMSSSFGADAVVDYKNGIERKQDGEVDEDSVKSNDNSNLRSTANLVMGHRSKLDISINNPVHWRIYYGPVIDYVESELAKDKVLEIIKRIVCIQFRSDLNEISKSEHTCVSDNGILRIKPSLNDKQIARIRDIRIFIVFELVSAGQFEATFERNIDLNLAIKLVPLPFHKFNINKVDSKRISFENEEDSSHPFVLGIGVIEYRIDWKNRLLVIASTKESSRQLPNFQNVDGPSNVPMGDAIRDGFKPISIQNHTNVVD